MQSAAGSGTPPTGPLALPAGACQPVAVLSEARSVAPGADHLLASIEAREWHGRIVPFGRLCDPREAIEGLPAGTAAKSRGVEIDEDYRLWYRNLAILMGPAAR